MSTRTQRLLTELTERWLSFDNPETQECLVYLARAFVGDREIDDLPHFQEALERQDREMTERYTAFGQLRPGSKFLWFGQVYEKIEPAKLPLWVNCRGPGGERYLSDGAAVEKLDNARESQDTQDRNV